MEDERKGNGIEEQEMWEEPPQPTPEEPAGPDAVQSGPDAAAGESSSSDTGVPPGGGDHEGGGTEGGGLKRWFADHKILTGIGIGVLVVLLLGAVFAIGHAVGRPETRQAKRVPPQQAQPLKPGRPDLRSAPSPGREGGGRGWLGILDEYRDELENEIAGELGISVDDLQDEMEDGKTIAEIAEEKGVSTEDLTASVAAKTGELADELAADGEISPEQAENIKSNAEFMASRLVEGGNRQAGMPPGRRRGR